MDPGGVDPDPNPDPTVQKKTDPDPTTEKQPGPSFLHNLDLKNFTFNFFFLRYKVNIIDIYYSLL